jgi:SAM-dependent methyltransferase
MAAIFPHEPLATGYAQPAYRREDFLRPELSSLPVPPKEFWASYCTSAESYLRSGQEDIAEIRRLVRESGAPIEQAGSILELGVAGGRLIRWLEDLAPSTEIWGVDLWGSAVQWCRDCLCPPFQVATTPFIPTLPFEDRMFGLIYAGSVWTHIDDLADAWLLECRRLLRPGGRLFITINDRAAVRLFEGEGDPAAYARFYERTGGKANWDRFVTMLRGKESYDRFKRGEVKMVTFGRSIDAHVLWDADYLCERVKRYFRVCSVTPAAYGHQTGIVFERI